MELNDISVEARNVQAGYDAFKVATEKTLKIETYPQGQDILNVTVPQGKKWWVQINVEITETDI